MCGCVGLRLLNEIYAKNITDGGASPVDGLAVLGLQWQLALSSKQKRISVGLGK